jgi:hypothetical protein
LAITSASTLSEIVDQYKDNVSYEEDGSVAKARLFVTACRALLGVRPSQFSANGYGNSFSATALQEEISQARKFINASATSSNGSGGVRYFDVGDFR